MVKKKDKKNTKKVVKKSNRSTKKVVKKTEKSEKKEKNNKITKSKVKSKIKKDTNEKNTKKVKKQEGLVGLGNEKGIVDEYGNWNGSTMTDEQIEAITDKHEQLLVKELDKINEMIKELRENDGEREDIANLVIEKSRIRAELNEINPNKYI